MPEHEDIRYSPVTPDGFEAICPAVSVGFHWNLRCTRPAGHSGPCMTDGILWNLMPADLLADHCEETSSNGPDGLMCWLEAGHDGPHEDRHAGIQWEDSPTEIALTELEEILRKKAEFQDTTRAPGGQVLARTKTGVEVVFSVREEENDTP